MTIENISQSISTQVWSWAGIERTTLGSAIKLATDCAMGPGHFLGGSKYNITPAFLG